MFLSLRDSGRTGFQRKSKIKIESSGRGPPLYADYWPVPVTLIVCSAGVAESVTVTAAVRVPTALGVKVTVTVHCAFAASVDVHGVPPPGAAV